MKSVSTHAIHYRTVQVADVTIFYREAGNPIHPTILLLHGFPSTSHMYRDLITDLADDYHLIAPDYPGFGHSSAPDAARFAYTFDHLATIINQFTEALNLTRFSLFIQDYGSPVGFRIATQHPERIQALLVQNGNAYVEGIGPGLDAIANYWNDKTDETAIRGLLTLDSTKSQYLTGVADPTLISPDSYTYDQYFLDRPGNDAIQLALFADYQNNLSLYDTWHAYLRENQPPTLITWGRNDPIFIAAGAEAYQRDLPQAELHWLNSGHFALEDNHALVADLIKAFLPKHGIV